MIQWIRSLIFFLGLNLIGIILIPPMILFSYCFSSDNYLFVVKKWCQIALCWFRFSTGIRYTITGLEYLEDIRKTPGIIVSNHQSTFETFLFPTLLPKHVYVLKQELLNIPIFGSGLKRLNPIAINRSEGRAAFSQMLKASKDRISKGVSIVVFPEGTRVAPERSARFKSGAFLLASKLNVPILPISLNSGMAWRKGVLMKNKGTIEIIIGPLIDSKNKTHEQLKAMTQEWIEHHKPKHYQSTPPTL